MTVCNRQSIFEVDTLKPQNTFDITDLNNFTSNPPIQTLGYVHIDGGKSKCTESLVTSVETHFTLCLDSFEFETTINNKSHQPAECYAIGRVRTESRGHWNNNARWRAICLSRSFLSLSILY